MCKVCEDKNLSVYQSLVSMDDGNPFPNLVDRISNLLGSRGINELSEDDINEILNIMNGYKSKRCDWDRYAYLIPGKYTRNLVDDGNGSYNLLLLVWDKNSQSPIHDHSGSHCIMKVLEGTLTESRYEWPLKDDNKPMNLVSSTDLSKDKSVYIHADKIGLHRVSNNTDTLSVSLHLYTPPYQICQTFCETSGNMRASSKCPFYSVKGVPINSELEENDDNKCTIEKMLCKFKSKSLTKLLG
ncbi:hypothetical protein ROZALSC1DRAFT_26749 [Rozella allomycis CSF55]|uniref:Cysteine dioxygenase n=1 Tax=Rozella allomycis (strain CSF55) TaxID=988480 RepID=A0A4V1IZM2_ROZAC|nr:hypothetical protein ROZALSC1DRAFT_29774 [Rozella allomycis CSF55]RKP21849.1 hypothetical protein ROZALSC1DRAFT_26749 [Rozella allomycis CSF55]